MLKAAKMLVDPQSETPLNREDIVEFIGEERLWESINNLNEYKYLEERGYADLLVSYYPSPASFRSLSPVEQILLLTG